MDYRYTGSTHYSGKGDVLMSSSFTNGPKNIDWDSSYGTKRVQTRIYVLEV